MVESVCVWGGGGGGLEAHQLSGVKAKSVGQAQHEMKQHTQGCVCVCVWGGGVAHSLLVVTPTWGEIG